jgi:hypothetical protein
VARKPKITGPAGNLGYKIAAKQTRIGEIEAADEREAIQKAAEDGVRYQLAPPP